MAKYAQTLCRGFDFMRDTNIGSETQIMNRPINLINSISLTTENKNWYNFFKGNGCYPANKEFSYSLEIAINTRFCEQLRAAS